jgi:hypothetical protein
MINKIRALLTLVLFAGAIVLPAAPAGAGLIATDQAVPVEQERERVKALVARPEVAKKLEALGVLPKDAASRVDALTDEEVRTLAARIDALPAGGLADRDWLLVIIIILLIVIAL